MTETTPEGRHLAPHEETIGACRCGGLVILDTGVDKAYCTQGCVSGFMIVDYFNEEE